MFYTIIIPARLRSTRLPNKMLSLIGDRPLIEWSWRAAKRSNADRIIIATDDQSIFDAMEAVGAEVVMTSADHETGTDRLSEVVTQLTLPDETIIVNWQGDEPFLPPQLVDLVASSLRQNVDASMSTLATTIDHWEMVFDPNCVKVICDNQSNALYFSRAPIPYPREVREREGVIPQSDQHYLRHIGVYAYRAQFLRSYPTLPEASAEATEKLEQLRALVNGKKIVVATTDIIPPNGIDTQADLDAAQMWLKDHEPSLQ